MSKRKRKRKLKRKRRQTRASLPTILQIVEYEITPEPLEDPAYERLPEAVKDRLDALHDEAQRNPRRVIPELLVLKEQYPDVPQIYNYLAAAYSLVGDEEKAEAIVDEILGKKPDYLFARINKAQFYLSRKEYEKIPELFDKKFDLKLLYPERNTFHISEVANFMGIIGLYFARTNQREIAERYNEMLQQIAPDFPIAQMLDRELNPSALLRFLERLANTKLPE